MASYSPFWAPHVTGTFVLQVSPEGAPEPTTVYLTCSQCGDRHQVTCLSGAPRVWVLRYAKVHQHADPMGIGQKRLR